jgi:hypothetical protein
MQKQRRWLLLLAIMVCVRRLNQAHLVLLLNAVLKQQRLKGNFVVTFAAPAIAIVVVIAVIRMNMLVTCSVASAAVARIIIAAIIITVVIITIANTITTASIIVVIRYNHNAPSRNIISRR